MMNTTPQVPRIITIDEYLNNTREIMRELCAAYPDAHATVSNSAQVSRQLLRHALLSIRKHKEDPAKKGMPYIGKTAVYNPTRIYLPSDREFALYAKEAPCDLRCDITHLLMGKPEDFTPEMEKALGFVNAGQYLNAYGGYAISKGYITAFRFRNPTTPNTIPRPTTQLPLIGPDD